jgi:hypothetical protein
VIDMDNEIASGKARHLGNEVLRAACRAARAHEAIAQNVLLADYGRLGGFEPAFEPKNGQCGL